MWRVTTWIARRVLRAVWEASVRLSGASAVTLWLEELYIETLDRLPRSGQRGRDQCSARRF